MAREDRVRVDRRRVLQFGASAAVLLASGSRGAAPQRDATGPGPLEAFPLEAVRLLPSMYLAAVESNRAYLESLEPDRLLHNYRLHAGLAPRGALYGGWESDSIAGHTLGHYLSALSLLHAQTGDAEAARRVAYIVAELAECQAQSSDGYLGGFTRRRDNAFEDGKLAMEEVKRGDIRARGFDLNGAWSPLYNWHKLMAGLLDADRYCGATEAIAVATRLGGYIEGMFAGLDDAQIQSVLLCEYGGLNESFALLHVRTNDPRWLALARKLYDRKVLQPLSAGRDELANLHANTQVPKLIGLERLYEITGESHYHRAARYFWELVTSRYSYVIGGNADREYFQAPLTISKHITEQTCESCNTYNMLRLTRQLYARDPQARYFDYYERAHFNHIMAQHHPATGMFAYMVPLMSGAHREFSSPTDDFWCCVGTGMESHAKHGDSIYWHARAALYINLYIPSRLTWQEQATTLELSTDYPLGERIEVRFLEHAELEPLTLALRIPAWCLGPELVLNGAAVPVRPHDGYVRIRRAWRRGDVLALILPFGLRLEPTADDSKTVALLYGPMVLAADLGAASEKWQGTAPVWVGATPLDHVRMQDARTATFATRHLGRPEDLTLRPFTLLHDRNTAVYFRRFDERGWSREEVRVQAEQIRQRELDARSADVVDLGDPQAERDHELDAKLSNAVVYRGRNGRDARAGGYFQFSAATAGAPLALQASYWGEERERRFVIKVDGIIIAREQLNGEHPGEFFERIYDIPSELTRDKARVIVRFEPEVNVSAGPVFGVRLLRDTVPPIASERL
jgi:DUF1680 family protein